MFWFITAALAVIGAIAGYFWHRNVTGKRRRFGAAMLILLPAWVVLAMMGLSEWLPPTHWLNIWGPDGAKLTPLEAAMLLTLLWAPSWSLGVICGYMTCSIRQRPLHF
jgi:hypothetical protein